jgi:WD40 repeat protein
VPILPPPAAGLDETATLPPTAAPETAERTAVPGYEILAELGRGGMGVVYKARHGGLNRVVALKMILAGGHAGPDDLARFRGEAEAVARLKHPNVVQVYDVGESGGLPYFSLEYVEGGSLDKKLAGTPLPPSEAAALVETLARAMAAAHAAGLVHRDLKPANILLTPDGTPKVTDFGLVKKLDATGQTASGAVMGTPSYMAPEQAGGKSKDIGPACDVYALGAILYECLTGRPPFKAATTLDTILQVVSEEPVPPRQLNALVPADLETVCLKCLQKEPGRRYAGAQALADDTRRFMEKRPVVARPVGRMERAAKWVRRNPAIAGLLLAVVLALVFGTAVASVFALQASARARDLEIAKGKSDENAHQASMAADEARTQERGARRALANTTFLLADAARREGDVSLARDRLNAIPQEWRGWEWHYLHGRLDSGDFTLRGHGFGLHGIAFSPDGRYLATAADDMLRVWDARTGQADSSRESGSYATSVAFSPNSELLAVGGPSWAWVIEMRTRKKVLDLQESTGWVTGVAFSPDGLRLATASRDRPPKVWDVGSGKELLTLAGHTGPVSSVTFSPDGLHLATASDDNTAKVWEADTGKELFTLKGHTGAVTSVCFSQDNQRLATASADRSARIWDSRSGGELRPIKGHAGVVTGVTFSPDGLRLATASEDKTAREWDARTGQELYMFKGHEDAVTAVAYSPDPHGLRVATASRDKTAKVWNSSASEDGLVLNLRNGASRLVFSPDGRRLAIVSMPGFRVSGNAQQPFGTVSIAEAEKEPVTFKTFEGHVTDVAFSPDGRNIAIAVADKTAVVVDAQTGKEFLVLKGITGWVRSVAYSPDGQRLATAGDEATRIWDSRTGEVVLTLKGDTQGSKVIFAPIGQRLATAAGQSVKVWDARTGEELLDLSSYSRSVYAFSPDGRHLATGAEAPGNPPGQVTVWDIETGRVILHFKGHTDHISGGCFSSDGLRLITASHGVAKVWDSATGQELLTLEMHDRVGVYSMAFSPDGQRLVLGGATQLKVWDAQISPAAD